MNTVNLPVSYLRASLICAGDKDIRNYLNGVLVRIRADDVILAATNGHRLSVFRVARTDNAEPYAPAEIIIPRDALKGIKAMNRHVKDCFLQYDAAQPLAECKLSALKDAGRVFVPVDGRFPDFTRVVPDKLNGERARFNPHYLAEFLDLVQIAADSGNIFYTLHENGDSAATLTCSALPEWFGVLMPMRGLDQSEYKRPEWLDDKPVALAEAA